MIFIRLKYKTIKSEKLEMLEFETLKIVEQKFRDIHSFMIRYNKE